MQKSAGSGGGLHWRDLLTGHIVADALIQYPKVYINIKNLKTEIKKPPARKEAWQDTLEAITPFEINEFRIRNGELTYLESAAGKPITVTGITFVAHNVKNIKSPKQTYPSDFSFEAVLFGSAFTASGQADFMFKPHAAVRADIELRELDLSHFEEIAAARHVALKKGVVSASGNAEFTPLRKVFVLQDFSLTGAAIDYLYSAKTEGTRKKGGGEAAEKAKEMGKKAVDKPGLLLKAKRIGITDCDFGFINKTSNPNYRVSMDDLSLEIHNFSNQFSEGPAELFMKGRFMGSGETVASGTFRPEKQGPDFNIRIAIKDTRMKAMYNVFRAYGKLDVSEGFFS